MKNKFLNTLHYIVYDFLVAYLSVLLTFLIANQPISFIWPHRFVFISVVWPITTIFGLYLVKVYNILWRFSGFSEIARIFAGCVIPLATTSIAEKAVFNQNIVISTYFLAYFKDQSKQETQLILP